MNKKIGIIATIVILVLGSIGIVRFFTKEDQKTTLTVSEKRWIENNKNNIIDFAALNNIPIVSDNGNGLFFDFLDSLESDTELEFNKLSYESKNDTQAKYLLEKKTDVKISLFPANELKLLCLSYEKLRVDLTILHNRML